MRIPLVKTMEAMVIGAGLSGICAAKLLRSKGFPVRLLEKNKDVLSKEQKDLLEEMGIVVLYGDFIPLYVEQCDCIIVSPGIPIERIKSIVYSQKRKHYPYILGEIELAYTFIDEEPIIAVTGTAGKTTTVSLIADILRANNLSVFLGGNIGRPFSEYCLQKQKVDVIVLELSSFQLQGIHYFHPKVAMILNISPNHLDYHQSMEEYIKAKINIVRNQTKDDFLLIPNTLSDMMEHYNIPSVMRCISVSSGIHSNYLLGEHNKQNIELAYQASRIFGVSQDLAQDVIQHFRSLPHRLEYVTVHKGITYINDSKSTTVDSLRVALRAIDMPIILLAGGIFKGGDLQSLRPEVKDSVKEVILFGASKEVFLEAFQDIVPVSYCATLEEATLLAKERARYGDAVLLSPATSSFDAFTSYIERGEAFKRVVLNTVSIE